MRLFCRDLFFNDLLSTIALRFFGEVNKKAGGKSVGFCLHLQRGSLQAVDGLGEFCAEFRLEV